MNCEPGPPVSWEGSAQLAICAEDGYEMASKRCSKCGKELIEGKRFCGGCGQAVAAAADPPPVPVATPAAAASACSNCGKPLVPGKRFCGFCGNPVVAAAPVAERSVTDVFTEIAPAPANEGWSSTPVASKSPESLPETVIDQPAWTAVPAKPEPRTFPAGGFSSAPPVQVAAQPSPASFPVPPPASPITAVLGPSQSSTLDSSDDWNYDWSAAAELTSGLQAPAAPVPASIATPQPLPAAPPPPALPVAPQVQPRKKSGAGIFIGIAAVVLLAAAAFWGWRTYSQRSAATVAEAPGQSSQPTAPVSTQPSSALPSEQSSPAAAAVPDDLTKPTPADTTPLAPTPQPTPSKSPASSPVHTPSTTPVRAPKIVAAPNPEPLPVPPLAPLPTAPRSGTFHYNGAPVPYNGQVVFDHLPSQRLKFAFDHQAWLLTIKVNPDGSKKVTLTSQKQGFQATCDLGWEIVE